MATWHPSEPNTLDPLDLYDLRLALSDEERVAQQVAARFVDERVLPSIQSHFENHTCPSGLAAEMGALGLLGASLSGYGCAGLSAVAYGVICQELERGDSAVRSFVSVQSSLCMYPIHSFGTEEQKQRYLPGMASGQRVGCFGLTESHGGSDPATMKTRAVRRGADWVLNGAKMWITNAPIADVAVVWAMTTDGIRGFLVDRDTEGFSTSEIVRKFSLRASMTGSIFLHEVRVPERNVLQVLGLKGPLSCLTQARFGIAWGVVGAAQACLRQALDYVQERTLFGRPLAATQSIQIRLANIARQLTGAQMLCLQLGRLKEQGRMSPVQVSVAKWNNCRMALDAARECRDILGAAGITADHVPIRHALNLESVITYEGTETIHQLTVGRELTGLSAF